MKGKLLFKKSLAMIISLVMLITTIAPFYAFAAESEELVANWDFSTSANFNSTVNSSDHLYAVLYKNGHNNGDATTNATLKSNLTYKSSPAVGVYNDDGYFYLPNISDYYSQYNGFKATWTTYIYDKGLTDEYGGMFALGTNYNNGSDGDANHTGQAINLLALNYQGTVYNNGNSGTTGQFAQVTAATSYTITLTYDKATKTVTVERVNLSTNAVESKSYTVNQDPVCLMINGCSKTSYPRTILKNLSIYSITGGTFTYPINITGYGCISTGSRCSGTSLTVCDDCYDSNFSLGYINFSVPTIDYDQYQIKSAEYTFTYTIGSSNREARGLSFYYPTQYLNDFSNSEGANVAMPNAYKSTVAGHLTKAISNNGLVFMSKVDTSVGQTNKSVTVDVKDAISYAIKNGLSYATVCIAISTPGGENESGGWTDTVLTVNKSSFNAEIEEANTGVDTSTITKYKDPRRPADGRTTGQPFIKGVTGGSGSNSFRIPGIVTLNDGTVVAMSDARWNTGADGGVNDTIVTRSKDNGNTWNYTFANYLSDNRDNVFNTSNSGFCDSEIATDGTNLWMLSTVLPAGTGLNSGLTKPSTGKIYTNDGHLYLAVTTNGNVGNYNYCLGDFDKNGFARIYNVSNGNIGTRATGTYSWNQTQFNNKDILVDENFNIYNKPASGGDYAYQTNLYFKTAVFSVRRTTHLSLRKSTDGGKTWSAPHIVETKNEGEYFYGVGPGRGVVSNDGKTILFSTYMYNGSASSQRTSITYSTDGGRTWNRSADLQGSQCSESQLVLLNDDNSGTLKLRCFFRSTDDNVAYRDATLSNGVFTWASSTATVSGCGKTRDCQISAITYSKTIGGKKVIFVSTPTKSGTDRAHGRIYALFLNDDYSIASTKNFEVTTSDTAHTYGYSCLTELADGRIGLLYESWDSYSDSNPCAITYSVFTLNQLTGVSQGDANVQQTAVAQDSSTSKNGTDHNYSSPKSIAKALYTYTETSKTDSNISGTLKNGNIYLTVGHATAGVLGTTSATTLNIRPTNAGTGYEDTFYIYNDANQTMHFYYNNNLKFDRCGNYSSAIDIEYHAMYIYKVAPNDTYNADGIEGFKRVKSLDEIESGDQLLFVHPNTTYASTATKTYYCVYPSTSTTNFGNHVGKLGVYNMSGVLNSDVTVTQLANTDSTIKNMIDKGAYTGSATRAADGSYSTSSLASVDSMSGVLWSFGVGGDANFYSQDGDWFNGGVQYGSITFLYDGTTPLKAPVNCFFKSKKDFWGSVGTIHPKSAYCATSPFYLDTKWHGGTSTVGYQTGQQYSLSYTNDYTDPNPDSFTGKFTDARYYSNTLKVNLNNISNSSFSNNLYDVSGITWNFYQKTNNSSNASSTKTSETHIYILNYKPIKDAMAEIQSFYNSNVKGQENKYTTDSLKQYYDAIKAVCFNPNSYFNTADTNGNNYTGCQSAILNAIDNIQRAKGTELVERQISITFNKANGDIKRRVYLVGDVVSAAKHTSVDATYDGKNIHSGTIYAWDSIPQAVALNNAVYTENSTPVINQPCDNEKGTACTFCNHIRIDYDAYDAAVAEYNSTIAENEYEQCYTLASRNNYMNALDNATDYVGEDYDYDINVTQDELNSKVAALTTAKENLIKNQFAVTVQYVLDDGTPVNISEFTKNYYYGDIINAKLPDELDGDVYSWKLQAVDGDAIIGTSSRSFTSTIKKNAKYICYLYSDRSVEATDSHRVTLYKIGNKVAEAKTLPDGEYVVSISSNIIRLGSYEFEAEDPAFYEIKGFKVNGVAVENGNVVTIDENSTIAPIFFAQTSLNIDRADPASDIMINGKSSLKAKWDEVVTLTAPSTTANTAWYIDDELVGYGTSYQFRATQPCRVRYENAQAVQANVRIDYLTFNQYKPSTVTIVSGYTLPENCIIVKRGVLLKTDRTTVLNQSYDGSTLYTGSHALPNEWWTSAINGTTGNFESQNYTSTNQYTINVTRTNNTSFVMGAVAYVVYTDAVGTQHTIFSNQKLIAYNE